jgi:IS5 family transposase
VELGNVIDWDGLESHFSHYYCPDNGRPGGSIRLMAGLLFLKEINGISDEELCTAWKDNPYFQYFCGEEYFQHCFPVEHPSIGNFRRRIDEKGMERLLQETVKVGIATGTVIPREIEQVNVDSTVQEKAVRFPTDTHLCEEARKDLVKTAKECGVELRQNYSRKGKHDAFMVNRYLSARQTKRARGKIKSVRNYLGRIMRDIERKIAGEPLLEKAFADKLAKANIIYNQTLNPKAKEKLYSWHATEVECIGKGKAHKRYEFGCKASYASTNKSNFIVNAMAHHGKPFDGHTLGTVLEGIERITGITPAIALVDRGYKGHGIDQKKTRVIMAGAKKELTRTLRNKLKRRNAIEPIIGHCKNDRKTGARNWLKGEIGDKINAIAMAIGFNLRKILRKIFLCLLQIFKFIHQKAKILLFRHQIIFFRYQITFPQI